MSLRSKLVVLFVALAVAPLLAVGLFEYQRADEAVRNLLGAQTASLASRTASEASDRIEALRSNLGLLAANEYVRQLLETGTDRTGAERYVQQTAVTIGLAYSPLIYLDRRGAEVMRVSPGTPGPMTASSVREFVVPIRGDTADLGSMRVAVPLDGLIPGPLLDATVGLHGFTAIADPRTGRVVLGHADEEAVRSALDAAPVRLANDSASVRSFRDGQSDWVGTIVPLREEGLVAVAAASVAEYTGPMARDRDLNLFLALAVACAAVAAFLVLSRRLTRPLEILTAAARHVGEGQFEPTLPPETSDEVGQLTGAIRLMSRRIADMLHQLETSRQIAAVGAFAAQLSHEIRNPLTSIKLNLQSVQRSVAEQQLAHLERPLALALREIDRLDRVVRGVLHLGQAGATSAKQCVSVHEVAQEAEELVRLQLLERHVALTVTLCAEGDQVTGDAESLRGALLNLILNAADALPHGGDIMLTTSNPTTDSIRVVVADNGPGVPAQDRERIFEPFFTTKRGGGAGLGLALAARDVESHRGRLTLDPQPTPLGGASFAIELPLALGPRA